MKKIKIDGVDISKLQGLNFDVPETNLVEYINECRSVLGYYGIYESNGTVSIHTTDAISRVKFLVSLVSDSCDLLDDHTLHRPHGKVYSESAVDYYYLFQHDTGDDTAFDYHGTYVQVVLDILLALLEN